MTGATAYKAALLEAAARYVAHGWQLFVCGNDKRPLQQGGFKNASTDLSRLDRVLTRHADGMLAVRTGSESSIVVIDVDVDTAKGIDGRGWLVEAQQKGLPDCPTTETPRGGTHLYFGHPGGSLQCSAGQLAKGVDVRGDGGYVISPPSRSPKGAYRWRPGPTAEAPPPLPEWLLVELTGTKIDTVSDHFAPPTEEDRSEIDREFAAALSRVRGAEEGTRADTLNRNSFLIGKMVGAQAVEYRAALAALIDAALAAGLEPLEARRTAESGMRAGMKRPWTPSASQTALHVINRDHFYALEGRVGFVFREDRDPLTGRAMLQYITPHSFREHHGNRFVLIQGQKGPRSVPVGDAWMKWSGRRRYEKVVFAPGKALSPAVYNLWQGFAVEVDPGNCEKFIGFLLHVICGNKCDQFEYLMSWMAAGGPTSPGSRARSPS